MKTTLFKIVVFSLLFCSCEKFNTSAQYTYQSPDSLGDGFEIGSLEQVHLEKKAIEKAISEIYAGRYSEVHSMLIYKDGMLVLDEYFAGHSYIWDAPGHLGEWMEWDLSIPHDVKSVTKSFTTTCIGIAIDQGFIESVHQSIFDHLPDHQDLKKGGKEKITIENLLTMTSGLEWREWSAPYSSGANPAVGIWYSDKDPITYILDMPLEDKPGTSFVYSTGNSSVLGEIIKNATQMDIDEFSQQYLFEPLGIDTAYWADRFDNGVIEAGGSLFLTPRSMAKVGAMFLNDGVWNGQQIISSGWIQECKHPFGGNRGINIPGEPSGKLGYSYGWWTKEYVEAGRKINMYAAGGWGGQHIMIFPEVDMVVVFTGGNYTTKRPPFKILEKYILPAILNVKN